MYSYAFTLTDYRMFRLNTLIYIVPRKYSCKAAFATEYIMSTDIWHSPSNFLIGELTLLFNSKFAGQDRIKEVSG